VMSITDVFLVEVVGVDLFLAMRCSQKLDEVGEELIRVLLYDLSSVVSKGLYIPHVRL
jgi:hypothetical protein